MEPNPEQTASILSMITYSFLDSIVFLAYRVPHLAHDQLPALADYDYAHNLKLKSFKVIVGPDLVQSLILGPVSRLPCGGETRPHLLGYHAHVPLRICPHQLPSCAYGSINTCVAVGSKQLTQARFHPTVITTFSYSDGSYLEAGDHNTTVRPWVWITCLFMSPFATSMFYQGFNFYTVSTPWSKIN
jgi:hypothetical protein